MQWRTELRCLSLRMLVLEHRMREVASVPAGRDPLREHTALNSCLPVVANLPLLSSIYLHVWWRRSLKEELALRAPGTQFFPAGGKGLTQRKLDDSQ